MIDWKLTEYIVISDTTINRNYQVVYSTRTAKSILLSDTVIKYLVNGEFTSISEDTLDHLIDIKIIVPADEDELATIISNNKAAIDQEKTLFYVIQPTAQCQLGCHYCGQQHTKNYLSETYYAKILGRIADKLSANTGYTHLRIGWFGAEPLMGLSHIKHMTPELKKLAAKNGCTYSSKMVTNGLGLKENIFRLLTELDVKQLEITLDGSAEYHDQRRHTKQGGKSFDLIFNNLLKIFSMPDFGQLGTGITIRCNVDSTNHEGVSALIQLLDDHQLQDKVSGVYLAPIHSWGNDAHLLSLEKENFAKLEMEWLIDLYQRGFNVSVLPNITKPIVCMTVSKNAEIIDAFGNIFNCTEVPYVPTYEAKTSFKIGNVKDAPESLSKHRHLSDWNDDILDKKFPCSSCRILPICGGACPKSWHEQNCPCPSIKFNIEDRLLLHYERTNKASRREIIS